MSSAIEYTAGTKECPRHRVIMIGSELIFATKHCHGEPIAHVYHYACRACGQASALTINPETK